MLEDSDCIRDLETVRFMMVKTVRSGNKIMLCGNGGSAADAQHIAAELVGRFNTERKGLPAMALTTDTSVLTAIGNDYGFKQIFERQIEALANNGDILIGISTSGNSTNVLKALQKAKEMKITTIGFLGAKGGSCKEYCDFSFIVNSDNSARVQEIHITIGHILCGIIDCYLEHY
jgi:D-sedoheptulose 7-phosphate isomerase